jgi:large subunit ribosomal protein L30
MPKAKKAEQKGKTLSITWKASTIGRDRVQAKTIQALGLKKLNHTVNKVDNPAIRGMIKKVEHLVEVNEA